MMNDDLIRDFFKLAPLSRAETSANRRSRVAVDSLPLSQPAGVGLFVRKISWNGPHEPVEQWVRIAEFPADPDPALVRQSILRALKQKACFKSCRVCGEKNPSGWMEGNTCHACMEKEGVIF